MNVSDLLEQPCNKSDNINKVVTSCSQLVPNLLTTWDKQCEHNLLADLVQDVRFLRMCKKALCIIMPTHAKISHLVTKFFNKPSTSCLRTACHKLSTSLEQAVNNL
jgi:hypothetical protein